MTDDFQNREEQRYIRMRSINDYSRGAIFILFGLFFIFFKQLNIRGLEYQDWYRYLGILFVVYGLWRIYRGYKKNYFR
jgi:hypothetical protein